TRFSRDWSSDVCSSDLGPITILGGVPDNSRGMTVYENSFTVASLGPFFETFGSLVGQGTAPEEAIMQAKDLLVKSDVEYIKPERPEERHEGKKRRTDGK